jgi:HAE1 family hydrophobic/amphiphilic exporter-1
MSLTRISSWSIRNPIPTLLLFIVLTIAGLMSYGQLRVNRFPDIDLPVVAVTVLESGAAPTEMETQVTRLIEDSVAGLGQVKHITSVVNEGVSTTSIEFQLGVNQHPAQPAPGRAGTDRPAHRFQRLAVRQLRRAGAGHDARADQLVRRQRYR